MSDQSQTPAQTPTPPRLGPSPLRAAYRAWWTLEALHEARRRFWRDMHERQRSATIPPNKEQRAEGFAS
jgi:hypothetical protein